MRPSMETDDPQMGSLFRAVRQKRYELERLRNEHEKERDQRRRDLEKYTADYHKLCQHVISNGMDLDAALERDHVADHTKKLRIYALRKEIIDTNIQRDKCEEELTKMKKMREEDDRKFEVIKLMYSVDAKDKVFRDKAAEFGVHFELVNVGNNKKMYMPTFTKEYHELEKNFQKRLPRP